MGNLVLPRDRERRYKRAVLPLPALFFFFFDIGRHDVRDDKHRNGAFAARDRPSEPARVREFKPAANLNEQYARADDGARSKIEVFRHNLHRRDTR